MRKIRLFIILAVTILTAAGAMVFLGCGPDEDKDFFSGSTTSPGSPSLGGGGTVIVTGTCTDGTDNDTDGLADTYGVPANCTIGLPTMTTSLGSTVTLTAVGKHASATPDTFTITVSTGGGSGAAQISYTSIVNGATVFGPITVTNGNPIKVGRYGMFVYFTDSGGTFNLVSGETWTVSVTNVTACTLAPDPGCFPPGKTDELDVCSNGLDDDGDTFVDSADSDCNMNCTNANYKYDWLSEKVQYTPECNDGIDNDSDGLIDGADPQCAADNCVDSEG